MRGLTLTGRVTYTAEQAVSNTNIYNLRIPSWTTFDVGGRYTFESPWNNKPITIRANIDNVFNVNYWAQASLGSLYYGLPRTYRPSATFNF